MIERTKTFNNEVLFIDSNIPEKSTLLQQIPSTIKVVQMDAISDPIDQMLLALNRAHNIDAIHIISHGLKGGLVFSNTIIDNSYLTSYQEKLQKLGDTLSSTGDILLYGCDIAKGDSGQSFIKKFATLTHADIAASSDNTGNAILGGNWNLEEKYGSIETKVLNLSNWDNLLTVNKTGLLADIYSTSLPTGEVQPKENIWQSYAYSFIANVTDSIPISFLFRHDPSFFYLDDISLYDTEDNLSINLISNGNFDENEKNWAFIGTSKLYAAGEISKIDDNNVWYDGAVGGFDGISQNISVIQGHKYKLTFKLKSDQISNTQAKTILFDDSDNITELLVYQGVQLEGLSIDATKPTLVNSADTVLKVLENSTGIDITNLFHISDIDKGQTITWSAESLPLHGILNFQNAVAISGSTDISPEGKIVYIPNKDFLGTDTISVNIDDGIVKIVKNLKIDITLPVDISNVTKTTFDLISNLNQTGTIYYVVVKNNLTQPSIDQIISGEDSSNNLALKSGSLTVDSNSVFNTLTIQDLIPNSNYSVYITAQNIDGKIFLPITNIEVKTAPSLLLSLSNSINTVTNNPNVLVSGLIEGENWQYSFDNGENWLFGTGSSFVAVGDGAKTVRVKQTDKTGIELISNSLNFFLDTAAQIPSAIINPDKSIVVSNIEKDGSWQYSVDDGQHWLNGMGITYIPEKSTTSISFRQIDSVGNISKVNTISIPSINNNIASFINQNQQLIETNGILTASGKLSSIDEKYFSVISENIKGVFGFFSIDNQGNWTYTTDSAHDEFLSNQNYIDKFTIVTTDSIATTISFNIKGTSDTIIVNDFSKQLLTAQKINGVTQNVLTGQFILQNSNGSPISQRLDKSWMGSDNKNISFLLDDSKIVGNNLIEAILENGSIFTLNTIDGSYTYIPSASGSIDNPIDSFSIKTNDAVFDFNINRLDLLDRDGIMDTIETNLANLANAKLAGDLNNDGIRDELQGAVTNIAWRTNEIFNAGLQGKLSSGQSIVSITATKNDLHSVDSTIQLSDISVLSSNSSEIGGEKPKNKGIQTPWDAINFSISSTSPKGLDDIDNTHDGVQTSIKIDISRAGETKFNSYMKYVSAQTIQDYKVADKPLVTLDGEVLTSADQAGWYDYTQRETNGNGAYYIKNNKGIITDIVIIFTDNQFGDDNIATNEISDPGLPAITNNPPLKTKISTSNIDVLPIDFQNIVLQDVQIDKIITQSKITNNPLVCLPSWTKNFLNISDAVIEKSYMTTKTIAPLNAKGNNLANNIIGNNGNNILNGLGNSDTLTGGDGADIFVFGDQDVITDFNAQQGDKIDMRGIGAKHVVSNFKKSVGDVYFDSEKQFLEVDINGDGVFDLEMQILGAKTISSQDVIF